ncbi:MAG: hypothetical protein A3D31_11805 [Candidatus Fluviicola riflensis]|nr:MAG: hypothetical protein CHH17_16235 [Candidatus Fluviicola riflensis]OGS77671.1 MAG: hypothetical protein A3D31_11805 [Candidatus Fluviicola riflensis]OGS84254.1 MAG: hypothetical protein A3E30_13215 [Fluviicola sp. RIFCSPHIGHO2_12_FULL_43_24]OGS84737.1 MAG: hypothetical protein A2724_08740 [Fluviicola sp. RIFCSPHIGHO2_01_FULL_43_53]
MSVFESRTGIDQQKTSPNSPVTVPQKVNSSTPGMQHLVENNVQLHRLNDLQQLSNTSARVMQLKALAKMADESPLIQLRSNGQVIQLASRVDWTSQQFQYNDAAGDLQTEEVGRTMTAHLEPDHPIKGADADSTSSPDLYNALKRHWEPGSKSWVRGHVLNHDLGGPNTTPNLFPITGHANGDHSNYVEEHVKSALHRGKTVDYTVTATQNAGTTNHAGTGRDIRNAGGTFDCVASWNEEEDDLKTISRTITSTPSLKAAFGNGAGARAGRSFSGVGYAEADTIAERDEEGDVTGGGDVPGYEIPDTWAHGNLDADGRTQWMTDHRVGASATNYRQNSVAVVDEEGANVEMGGV